MNSNFEIKSLEKVEKVLSENKDKWLTTYFIQQELEFSLTHNAIKTILNYLVKQKKVSQLQTGTGYLYKINGVDSNA